jgi:precorrin-2 dehydrogenase/sirohydrochlorin ferrochelatase
MFPIILDVSALKIVVVGNGPATIRRLKLLDDGGARHLIVFADEPSSELIEVAGQRLEWRLPTKADFEGASVVFFGDFEQGQALGLAEVARNTGALVNTEDVSEGCDFHVPAIVRRGDLQITVSTGGKSPRLARRIRQLLEKWFPDKWAEHVDEIGVARDEWKSQGAGFKELVKNTDELIEKRKWLEKIK